MTDDSGVAKKSDNEQRMEMARTLLADLQEKFTSAEAARLLELGDDTYQEHIRAGFQLVDATPHDVVATALRVAVWEGGQHVTEIADRRLMHADQLLHANRQLTVHDLIRETP